MMNKLSEIRATTILLQHGTEPFFAKDIGLASGDIQVLSSMYFIEWTGNVRDEFVEVYDNHYIKVQAKEWRMRRNYSPAAIRRNWRNSANAVFELADMLKKCGF